MSRPGFTQRALKEIHRAEEIAGRLHHESIGTGHLLLAIASEEGMATAILYNRGLDYGMIDQEVAIVMAQLREPFIVDDNRFTLNALRGLDFAIEESELLEAGYIGTEHLLLGLAREGSGVAATALRNLDVEYTEIRTELSRLLGG